MMTNATKLLTFDPQSLPEDGITIQGELQLTELDIPETDRISFPWPFSFDLHVGPVHGGVLARGQGATTIRCRCDRCLRYYNHKLNVDDICHFFKNAETELINLTDDVRQDILLSFPQTVYCAEDCRGLCPECGQNLNVRDCGCRPAAGPAGAWDVLDELKLPEGDETE